jgi:PTH1 family peptidyl-tRNA hydrolase
VTFRRTSSRPVGLVILGLGNPGREYRDTRHNVGFMTLDLVGERLGVKLDRRGQRAHIAEVARPGDRGSSILLAKPQTWMNLSGDSAAALLKRHNLRPADLWVVYDEMDIPFGTLRIRKNGSAGGHNGVKSIIGALGSNEFPRFRVGVGRPGEGPDPIDHLLSPFTDEERKRLPELLELGADAVVSSIEEGIDAGMNTYNGRSA